MTAFEFIAIVIGGILLGFGLGIVFSWWVRKRNINIISDNLNSNCLF